MLLLLVLVLMGVVVVSVVGRLLGLQLVVTVNSGGLRVRRRVSRRDDGGRSAAAAVPR